GAVDLAAAPEQAAEGELDFGGIAVGLGHAREDLGGVVEAVVDEMIESDVVVARQPHGAGGAVAPAEEPGREPDQDEGQGEQVGAQSKRDAMTITGPRRKR